MLAGLGGQLIKNTGTILNNTRKFKNRLISS